MKGRKQDAALDAVVMTVHEVARYLKLSEAKVYQMSRIGTVPAIRLGKTWRFRKDLIDEWMRRETKKSSRLSRRPLNRIGT
jgi:excisionase family DNA binding protein